MWVLVLGPLVDRGGYGLRVLGGTGLCLSAGGWGCGLKFPSTGDFRLVVVGRAGS